MDSTPSEPESSQPNSRKNRSFRDWTTKASAPVRVNVRDVQVPFAWQHGLRLLMLDEEPVGWVMAELAFVPAICRYAEVRRTVYDWEREAVGSLMSRAFASGEGALQDAANSINEWLLENYGHTIDEMPNRTKYRYTAHLS